MDEQRTEVELLMKFLLSSEFSNYSSKLLPRKAVTKIAWIWSCSACVVHSNSCLLLAEGRGQCGASNSWEQVVLVFALVNRKDTRKKLNLASKRADK